MPIFSLPSIGGWLALAGLALTPAYADAMDLNRASQSELQSLRGVGAKTAALIVQERSRGGPYESLENLSERVRGVGQKKAASLAKSGLRVAPGQGVSGSGRSSLAPGLIIVPATPARPDASGSTPSAVDGRPRRPMHTP